MFMSVKKLENMPIQGTDRQIGCLRQVYFDDEKWVIRYLVVETDQHIGRRRVLVSPIAAEQLDLSSGSLQVRLDSRQIAQCPDVDADMPVSRQKERAFNKHFGYAAYWHGPGPWGEGLVPMSLISAPSQTEEPPDEEGGEEGGDPCLRSSREVIGYRIQASDGSVGRIRDLIFDLMDWSIYYLEVGLRVRLRSKRILLDPRWVNEVRWREQKVFVGVSRQVLRTAPPFETFTAITPEYAVRLGEHYCLPPRRSAARGESGTQAT
jgi:hypothetical protein